MVQLTDNKRAFKDFLRENSNESSNKAASYVRALDLLGPILYKKALPEFQFADIWNITTPETIRKLYDYVCEQQHEGESGIFVDETPRSYWEGGFMSAALRSFLEFQVIQNHEARLWDMFKNEKRNLEDLSQLLQQQEVDSIDIFLSTSI